jgi:hypothetical protein
LRIVEPKVENERVTRFSEGSYILMIVFSLFAFAVTASTIFIAATKKDEI